MKFAAGWSVEPTADVAVEEAYAECEKTLGGKPDLMLVHASPLYDSNLLINRLRIKVPDVPLHGGTTCLGVMTVDGFHSRDDRGLGILCIRDPEGSFGVGICEVVDDVVTSARKALESALVMANRSGEVPSVILISSYPGEEEHVIKAVEQHVGSGVPIFGGTSADNDMSGKWLQFGNDTVSDKAISIAVLFSSGEVSYAFRGGYEPTEHKGVVTRASGRMLYEIDSRPAAKVYNEWTGGLASEVLADGGSLVPVAALSPLGTPVNHVKAVSYYRIAYPVAVSNDESLSLYTDIREGDEIALMSGTENSLLSRPGRVAATAVDNALFGRDQVEGAFMIFCTGAMLAVKDRVGESVESIATSLGGAPYLCTFTLGEQGCFLGGENRHANLMIAVLVFGPEVV